MIRRIIGGVVCLVLTVVGGISLAGDLDLRPITRKPELLTNLHPKLAWMKSQKIRCTWIGNDLYEKFEDGDKTMGQVLKETGFNLVSVGMIPNSDDQRTGVVDVSAPSWWTPVVGYDIRRDRSKSKDIETRLAPNVKEARRLGLNMMVRWKYGTHHLEPYRKYRSPKGEEHKYTCCPLDEDYIKGQHIGNWAEKIARGGADGVILDMEMYHSDDAWPEGACACDDCFTKYLNKYAQGSAVIYNKVAPEDRGKWLADQDATTHYADFASTRMEAMYDSIRARCQKINPAFFFGVAPQLYHMPGLGNRGAPVERGLGTAKVPCLVFSEHEYNHGPYRGSYLVTGWIREEMPALYLPGAYVKAQSPQMMAENMVLSTLYCDGWWAWYGTAMITNTGQNLAAGDYGRYPGTSARDYLYEIITAHKQIDKLLASPKNQWPERFDGKLKWLKGRVTAAEAEDAKSKTEESAKALAEAKTDLENYIKVVGAGGS